MVNLSFTSLELYQGWNRVTALVPQNISRFRRIVKEDLKNSIMTSLLFDPSRNRPSREEVKQRERLVGHTARSVRDNPT